MAVKGAMAGKSQEITTRLKAMTPAIAAIQEAAIKVASQAKAPRPAGKITRHLTLPTNRLRDENLG